MQELGQVVFPVRSQLGVGDGGTALVGITSHSGCLGWIKRGVGKRTDRLASAPAYLAIGGGLASMNKKESMHDGVDVK